MSEQKRIENEQTTMPVILSYINNYYLNNLPPTLLIPTPIEKYTSKQLMMDKLDHTNGTGMEHVSLSVITVGSK